MQLNGTAGMAERRAGGEADLPSNKFQIKGETSAGFSSSELSQAGVAKEERRKKKRGGGGEREIKTEYRKTERMRFARMKSPVRDNIVNLAARMIITRGK